MSKARGDSKVSDWIEVENQLPEAGRKVIAYFENDHGNGRRIMAFYMPKHHKQASEFDDMDMDYCEKTDEFYWPAGFYECTECAYGYIEHNCFPCHEKITHWRSLPAPPSCLLKAKQGKEYAKQEIDLLKADHATLIEKLKGAYVLLTDVRHDHRVCTKGHWIAKLDEWLEVKS